MFILSIYQQYNNNNNNSNNNITQATTNLPLLLDDGLLREGAPGAAR